MALALSSYLLILGTICLIMQEEFLVEKVPYILFYTCKLILKTLSLRARFERKKTLKDYFFLWLVCFGKKTILDIAYYQVNWIRYIRYSVLLLVIDYSLDLLSRKELSHRVILKAKPVKAFLMLASGICDSISLENLLWRNHINGWLLDVAVFFFVILDPLLYIGFAWFFKGQKKEKNFSSCQRNLNFGVFLALMHSLFSLESYSSLIELRRQIPFNSSNVMTPSVGMRLLNCIAYVIFVTYSLAIETESSNPVQAAQISQIDQDESSKNYIKQKKDMIINQHLTQSKSKIDKIMQSPEDRKMR